MPIVQIDQMFDSQESFQPSQTDEKHVHFQSISMLQKIDLNQESNRQWLSKCYRKLTSLIHSSTTTKFNLSQKSQQLPDKVVKSSYDIKPYEFNLGLEMYSKQFCSSTSAKKKCEMPLIYKYGLNGWEVIKIENGAGYVKENSRFNIRIQAEEHSTIVMTYQDNHPLRVKPQQRQNFRQNDNTLIEITPPCIISIVVINQQEYFFDFPPNQLKTKTIPFKLPSNYIRLEVKKNSQGEDRNVFNRRLGQEFMIRPQETFDHGLSNSQGSNWHPFVPIETESRSRD